MNLENWRELLIAAVNLHFRITIYLENSMVWFDFKTQCEVMNFKVFSDVRNSVGVSGLNGLDRLICFTIVIKLQVCLMYLTQINQYFCRN